MATSMFSGVDVFFSPPRAAKLHLSLCHQLAEMLLTEVIGLSWAKAHAEAKRMEHAISSEVGALLMKRSAGHETCPHGVPLCGGFAQLRKEGAVLFSELQLHDSAEIVCVYEKEEGFFEFLENLHLRPSTKVEVLKREYDETMTLRAAGRTMHLGKPATSRIWVRRLAAERSFVLASILNFQLLTLNTQLSPLLPPLAKSTTMPPSTHSQRCVFENCSTYISNHFSSGLTGNAPTIGTGATAHREETQ
jgi:Iron dependent repressor, metal binding and dimerisation domain/FeoA domain